MAVLAFSRPAGPARGRSDGGRRVVGHLLWPGWGQWTDASQGVLALLAGAAALLFVRQLTGTPARFRWLDRAIYVSGLAGVGMAGIFLLLSKPVALAMVGGYVGYAAVANTWIAWLSWRRGDVVGLWVLGAYLPLTLLSGITVTDHLRNGVYQHTSFAMHFTGAPGVVFYIGRNDSAVIKTKLDEARQKIRTAIEAPLRQIATNGGLEGAIVVNKVRESKDGHGYNARTNEYAASTDSRITSPS